MPTKADKRKRHQTLPVKTVKGLRKKLFLSYGVAILCISILGAILLIVLHSFNKVSYPITASQITEARNRVIPGYFDVRNSRLHVLVQSGAVMNASPDGMASTDTCSLSDQGGGWSISAWHQSCFMQNVDVFGTDLTASEITAKLAVLPNISQLFGQSEQLRSACGTFYRKTGFTLSYVLPTQVTVRDCRIPDITVHPSDPAVKKNILTSFDSNAISGSHAYIIMESDENYFDKSVGCRAGIYLGCGLPISSPITDF